MQCPSCNAQNREGARFCGKCGARLILICPQCQTELLIDALFCDACGAQVSAPPPAAVEEPASAAVRALERLAPKQYAERLLATRGQVQRERRTVTILFSDVKGSTAMGEGLDPEDVMEIMDGAFDVLIEPIYRYEGTLARLMGDAILAFFGAPIAHEDDPERACRAALEIVEGARVYAERLERERGIAGFNVRVGINTGLVVVGEVGSDLRVEYTAMGDAINLAARMESAAEAGTILIAEDTHKLIAPLFETEARGPIEIRGKRDPVPVYRLLAAKAAPGKVRGIAGLESPLVGREAEFAALREALERLRAGVGGIVTLVGEAGIGKSRLVAELRKHPSAGLQWVEGRCLSYGTSIPYLPWLDVLRSALGVSSEEPPEAVAEALARWVEGLCPEGVDAVYPYLARRLSLRPEPVEGLPLEEKQEEMPEQLDGQQLRERTFAAAEAVVRRSAEQEALVLVLEDLHWADNTSLALLEHVLPLVEQVPLLVVAVFRPHKGHGSWRLRETAADQYADRHVDLLVDPLTPSDSARLVANLLRVEALPAGLRERIMHRAEGNPFYLEEVIRSLIDSGAIVQDEATDRWAAKREVADIPMPDTLQGVLMARIDRLQEDTKRVLQMASVIGRIFLYRVLAAITATETVAREERRLDQQLLTLQQEEMIRERARLPELEYIFKHELTREAAYNGLLRKERRVFHCQVAEALEGLLVERAEEQVGLLAHHWERAGDAEKATAYLVRAGDQARTAYAHQEAIDYYQRALGFLKERGEQERAARTLMKLGLTYHTAFDFRRSRQAYEEGFALWQRAGEVKPAVPPPAPHALRVAWPGAPRTVDPPMVRDSASGALISHLFSGLVELTPEMDVVPGVAHSWEVLEGGRKYAFHLRDDARWSDGTPVTAADFEYPWKRMLDPVTESPNASVLYDVKGARRFHQGEASDPDSVGVWALDEVTLVVELERPTGHLPHLLTYMATYPVPRHVVEAHGEAWTDVRNIVTNGPFKLEAWQRGESLAVVRNPEYRRPFTGNVQRVELFALEWSAALELYAADGLDIVRLLGPPPLEMDRARPRQAGEYVSVPWLLTFYMGFDVSRPPFSDPRVRRAFVLATDREALADIVMKGSAFPATGGFVPPGMPGHSAGIGLPYDPQQGQQRLAEAGYPGGRGFPVVDGLASEVRAGWCEYLRAQWQENLGIEIMWETMETGRLLARLDREPVHVFLSGWLADYPDPDSFLRASSARHQTRWQNEAYERLVEEARRVTDQGERVKLYRQADRILVEEAAIVPFVYGRLNMLVKPWVRNYPTSAMTGWFWKDVVIEPH